MRSTLTVALHQPVIRGCNTSVTPEFQLPFRRRSAASHPPSRSFRENSPARDHTQLSISATPSQSQSLDLRNRHRTCPIPNTATHLLGSKGSSSNPQSKCASPPPWRPPLSCLRLSLRLQRRSPLLPPRR